MGDELASYHIPLGFKSSEHLSVLESIIYIIGRVETFSNITILDKNGKPKIPVYISGDIASTELEGNFKELPISGIDALRALNMSLIDVGYEVTYVRFFSEKFQSFTLSETFDSKKASMEKARQLFLSGLTSRKKVEVENILAWIPFNISPSWINNYIKNKVLYPQIIPESDKELRVEQAFAKEKISEAISDVDTSLDEIWQEEQKIVATGGVLSFAPRGEQVVSMVLDGLKPKRAIRIYWDKKQLVPCIGTLKLLDQKEGDALLRKIDFDCLATVVTVPIGVTLKIDFGLKNIQEIRVEEKELFLFPLEKGKQAKIIVEAGSEAVKREASVAGGFTCLVEGGEVGLVIDARGRPLERPSLGSKGRGPLSSWEGALNVYGKRAEI